MTIDKLLKKLEEVLLFTRDVQDQHYDIPPIDVDDEYKTHVNYGTLSREKLGEQKKKDKKDKEDKPDEELTPEEAGEEEVEDLTGEEIPDSPETSEDVPDEVPDEMPEEDKEDTENPGEPPPDEATEEDPTEVEATAEEPPPEEPDATAGAGEDPTAAGDMGGAGVAGEDPTAGAMGDPTGGMGGMGQEEEPKTPEEIGRVYELKKIYSRLVSMESYLSDSSDTLLLKLRNYVSQSIELFETVISNVETFKDRMDDIIVIYYEFLDRIYLIMRKYYQVKEAEDEKSK